MGTCFVLVIHEGLGARPAQRLAAVVAALAASGDVDPESWSVESAHASDRGVAMMQERARRERWPLRLGQRTSAAQLLEFLSTTEERELRISVNTPVTRCDLRLPEPSVGAPELLELEGDVQINFDKQGVRYLADSRARDDHLQYLLAFITRLADHLRPRAIHAGLDTRDFAPPLSLFAWYRDELALLGDAALTARWLERMQKARRSAAIEGGGMEPQTWEFLQHEDAIATLRALDVAAVRRVLAEDRAYVLRPGTGFFVANLQMDPLQDTIAPFFVHLVRGGTRR